MAASGFYEIESVDDPIGSGATGSHWCTLGGVVKTDAAVPYTVANEFFCGRLGFWSSAYLSLPAASSKKQDGVNAYAMMRFGVKGQNPPPVDPAALVLALPHLAAGVVVFDCWVRNTDRHQQNLAFVPPSALSVFDHSHALFGNTPGEGEQTVVNTMGQASWTGCLLGELTQATDLSRWAERVGGVHDDVVEDIAIEAKTLGICTAAEAHAAATALNSRKRALRGWIDSNKASFAKIPDTEWGLIA